MISPLLLRRSRSKSERKNKIIDFRNSSRDPKINFNNQNKSQQKIWGLKTKNPVKMFPIKISKSKKLGRSNVTSPIFTTKPESDIRLEPSQRRIPFLQISETKAPVLHKMPKLSKKSRLTRPTYSSTQKFRTLTTSPNRSQIQPP